MKKNVRDSLMPLGLLLLGILDLPAEEIYRSDFAKGASKEIWNPIKTSELQAGGESILGVFETQDSTAMSLEDLPAHQLVRLRFDLLLLEGFDGNYGEKYQRADAVSIGLADGPLLFTASLSAHDPAKNKPQSYPDEWPHANHPAQTGRVKQAEKNPKHQRYHFDISFPHDSEDLGLILRVGGSVGGIAQDEKWGFSNVIVDALPELKALPADPKKIDALWNQLSGNDPIIANQAVWEFIGAGAAGLKAIDGRAKPKTLSKQQAAELAKKLKAGMAGLVHEQFVERQKASSAIGKLGPEALPLIDVAIADKATDAGVRTQLKRIRKRIVAKSNDSAAKRVAGRVAHVRRVLGTGRKGMRASSPRELSLAGWDNPVAVIDGFVPAASVTSAAPRFTWWPEAVGDSWLRIDLGAEKEISKCGVFWFFDAGGTQLPAKWKLEFLAADKKTWKEVGNPSGYGIVADKFNEVRFDKIKTTSVRIVVTFNGVKSTGVHEVYVK